MAINASIFLSYNHRDKEVVHEVAKQLEELKFHVWLDEWDLKIGDSLFERISESINQVDFLAAFISENSLNSRWCQKELSLAMTGEVSTKEITVLPVLLDDAGMPASLADKFYLDAKELDIQGIVNKLVSSMQSHLKPNRNLPQRARKPRKNTTFKNPVDECSKGYESPEILGIYKQGITEPRNDGSRGSALYSVPFLLSVSPDSTWADLAVRNWNLPPVFTSMHRPGIAKVVGNQFILDGTTLDEIERYHLETVRLVIEKTNEEYEKIMKIRLQEKKCEQKRKESHEYIVEQSAQRLKSHGIDFI